MRCHNASPQAELLIAAKVLFIPPRNRHHRKEERDELISKRIHLTHPPGYRALRGTLLSRNGNRALVIGIRVVGLLPCYIHIPGVATGAQELRGGDRTYSVTYVIDQVQNYMPMYPVG